MLTHHGTQTIRTQRLILRRFTPQDAEPMFRTWASDSRVTRFLTWEPHESAEVTRTILKGWCSLYANPAYYHWGIEWNGRLIGGISVVRQNEQHEVAELGYCIGADYWGQGIATEAAEAVIDYLMAQVGAHRVTIKHAMQNGASGRVAEKCGMRYEGTLRGEFKAADGTYWDIAVHGILREEWLQRTQGDTHAN